MKNNFRSIQFTLIIIFLFLISCFTPLSEPQQINQNYKSSTMLIDGQILYSPIKSMTTYLRDRSGLLNHTWYSTYAPGVAVWWLGDGTILRTIRADIGPGTGGAGGGVQKVEWDGTVVWDFRYNTNGVLSHHDVKTLPNGNIFLIAWETKTREEAIAAGRNPANVDPLGFMPDHIIEVKPTGPTSGEIVWEWHVWDHLIQDYDASKANYGVVADHPELVDINWVTAPTIDWMHTNSIDYNEEFNQILISVCYFHEIWVIDHSTTTEEAAGHTGGNSGKGGDLLYRWGNPQTYRAGSSGDQKFFSQHDANWIDEGCPGAGNILVFNNGYDRPGDQYSSVDEIIPPVDDTGDYNLTPGSPYGPSDPIWVYTGNPPTSFYAYYMSGAQRLPSGNTLISNGVTGEIFEVTPDGTTIWQYDTKQELFKVVYISPESSEGSNLDCTGSLSWTRVKPGQIVNGSFQLQNIGDAGSLLDWTINSSSLTWGNWSFFPESGEDLTPENGKVTVQVSVKAPDEKNTRFEGYLRVENRDNASDFDMIPVYLKTPVSLPIIPLPLYHFFMKWIHPFSEALRNFLLRYATYIT